MGALFGIGMLIWGVGSMVRGYRELRGGSAERELLGRVEPAPAPLAAWQVCPPDEVAYAQSRPEWTPPAGVDLTGPWNMAQRNAAAHAVFPAGVAATVPRLRDCAPASGAVFQRLLSITPVEAILADASAPLRARVVAASAYSEGFVAAVSAYCANETLDDYQWECARLTGVSMQLGAALLPVIERTEQEDPAIRDVPAWVQGQATMRTGLFDTGADALRLLEVPAGVRPGVRLLLANTLAEDYPTVRRFVPRPADLVPQRQRLSDLAARETQPDVQAALTRALAAWP